MSGLRQEVVTSAATRFGLSESEWDLLHADSGIRWAQETDQAIQATQNQQDALQTEQERAIADNAFFSQKYGDGINVNGINARGRYTGNVVRPGESFLTAALAQHRAANFLRSNFNMNFIAPGTTGFSELGRGFTTEEVFVTAQQAEQIQQFIAQEEGQVTADLSHIADQDFVAYVLHPELVEAKENQASAGWDNSDARDQFMSATTPGALEREGILMTEDGRFALSPDALEESLSTEFTQADGASSSIAASQDQTIAITTFQYTGEERDPRAEFNGANTRPDNQPADFVSLDSANNPDDPESNLFPSLTLDSTN